jgi:hypothetical protein
VSSSGDVVIIGAPRSGTNMLRDVLTALPGYGTWDCDEINLTWRHGNRDFPSDELGAEQATPSVQRYVSRAFDRARRGSGAPHVVEKTCANSLRVEFVHRIAPEARYLFITRDGLDAAASAMQRWHAPFDVRYTLAKARYAPPGDLAHHGLNVIAGRLRRRPNRSGAGAPGHGWWGPKPHDWERLSATRPLDEVAVIQWQRCVEVARRGLATVPADQVHHVVYEDFVRDPRAGLSDVLDFLGDPRAFDQAAVDGVRASSIGKGRAGFSSGDRRRLAAVAGETLESLGYAH